jgi:phosphoribosylpyrophosphate synthetase
LDEKKKICPKLTVISTATLLADAIDRVHTGQSLSHLFEEGPRKFAKRRYSNN